MRVNGAGVFVDDRRARSFGLGRIFVDEDSRPPRGTPTLAERPLLRTSGAGRASRTCPGNGEKPTAIHQSAACTPERIDRDARIPSGLRRR